jgi:hypothetical protein
VKSLMSYAETSVPAQHSQRTELLTAMPIRNALRSGSRPRAHSAARDGMEILRNLELALKVRSLVSYALILRQDVIARNLAYARSCGLRHVCSYGANAVWCTSHP